MTFVIGVSDYKIARLGHIRRVSCLGANCMAETAVTCNRYAFVAVDYTYKDYVLKSIQYAHAITDPLPTSCCSSGIVLYRISASRVELFYNAIRYGMYTYSPYTDSYHDIIVMQYKSEFHINKATVETTVESMNIWTTAVITLALPAVIA
jgi:hypothetical protein